jgi:Protein of unknown function (DUF3089)
MKQNSFFFANILLLAALLFASCASSKKTPNSEGYAFTSTSGAPDYTKADFWAAHPKKLDPSDSLPRGLSLYASDTPADVFFLHPTTFTGARNNEALNAAIDDAALNAKTDYSTILYQASAFNAAGRIFAPRYRQAHISAYFMTDKEKAKAAFDLAYNDIRTAFLYYMEHENKGRAIIIASHSQGTTHALRLLKEFFDDKPLENQLVAAYLVGMPIPPDFFTRLKPCNTPTDTHCFCGWRTYKKGYDGQWAKAPSITTNPISWNSNPGYVGRDENKGAVLKNFNKITPRVAGAEVRGNVLWTRRPRFFGSILLRTKNYHVGDINLYYMNIRENAVERVKAFKQ